MAWEADSIGLIAARTLDQAEEAIVLAAFQRSFYLDADGELIAVVDGSLCNGPLNLRTTAVLTADLGVAPGQRWCIGPNHLHGPNGLEIDLSKASIWEPKTTSPIDRTAVSEGFNNLQVQLAQRQLPEEGLLRLVLPAVQPISAVEKAAAPAITRLDKTLREAFEELPSTTFDGVTDLLGLGPGLTPSGDDVLGGVLIACHRLGEIAAAEKLADAVNARAALRTNAISHAHLRAATLGYGAAPLHDLLDAVIGVDQKAIARALDATAKIGHSSGFDALGGIYLAFRCYLGSTAP